MPPYLRRLAIAAAAVVTVAVSACGSSSSGNSGNGGVGTGGHDSPENAARGFINALSGFNGSASSFAPVVDWVNPSSRATVQAAIGSISSQAVSVKLFFQQVNVGNASTSSDGVHASVSVGGSLCYSYSASGGFSSTSCSTGTSAGGDALQCIREGGQWYVDGSLFGSGGSSSSSSLSLGSSTETGSSSDTLGGSGSSSSST